MAEPTSTGAAIATAASVSITAMTPGVDGSVLLGAFAGALIYTLYQKEQKLIVKAIHLAVSVFIGYMAAADVVAFEYIPIRDASVAAFVASASVITLMTTALDKLKNFDLLQFWRKGE